MECWREVCREAIGMNVVLKYRRMERVSRRLGRGWVGRRGEQI